jgi:hypothetical protein
MSTVRGPPPVDVGRHESLATTTVLRSLARRGDAPAGAGAITALPEPLDKRFWAWCSRRLPNRGVSVETRRRERPLP